MLINWQKIKKNISGLFTSWKKLVFEKSCRIFVFKQFMFSPALSLFPSLKSRRFHWWIVVPVSIRLMKLIAPYTHSVLNSELFSCLTVYTNQSICPTIQSHSWMERREKVNYILRVFVRKWIWQTRLSYEPGSLISYSEPLSITSPAHPIINIEH